MQIIAVDYACVTISVTFILEIILPLDLLVKFETTLIPIP